MRCMRRNKREFFYATFAENREIKEYDEYNNRIVSGEQGLSYNEPVKCKANISPASGSVVSAIFGATDGYDKIIILGDPDTPINEYSVLWIDRKPDEDNSSQGIVCGGKRVKPYDYIVKRVSRGLHEAVIAVAKVNVRG